MMPDASLLPRQETAAQVQNEIVEAFGCFDDWTERYQLLIEMGRALPALAPEERSDRHRVRGCRALTWFVAEAGPDGRLHFRAASESATVAGLLALLLRVYSGRRRDEILGIAPDFPRQSGLDEHLSPHRQTAVLHILEQIQAHARAALQERSA
jgi:cysteine desulfuration protein SufE